MMVWLLSGVFRTKKNLVMFNYSSINKKQEKTQGTGRLMN